MSILTRYFRSTEATAKEMALDDENILQTWQNYLKTVPVKENIIKSLSRNEKFQELLPSLRKLIEADLVDISGEEKLEEEIIKDLEALEHSKKIQRVHRLSLGLKRYETRYQYVFELLRNLHLILANELHLVDKLIKGAKEPEKLITNLAYQLELEQEIIKKIGELKTFHEMFLALIKGEHIIKQMDKKEKLLLKRMQSGISKIFSNEISERITYEWVKSVFNAVEDKIREWEAKGIEEHHEDTELIVVNSQEFVNLVRETIYSLKKRKVSEQMINVFVHIFREWDVGGKGSYV